MIWTKDHVELLEEAFKTLAEEPRDVLLPICYSLPALNRDSDDLQQLIMHRLDPFCMYSTWLSRCLNVDRNTLPVERIQYARMQWVHDLIIEGRTALNMPLPEPVNLSKDPHP